MTQRKTSPAGAEHWKVRVVMPGALIHLASRTEPIATYLIPDIKRGLNIEAEWISGDPTAGDTLGHIDWDKAIAVTWRWTGAGVENEPAAALQ